jgi:hypothetical protein
MTLPTRGALSIVGLLLIALAVPARADLSFSRADADSLQRKIGTILEGSAYTSRTSAARSRQTPILEREVNAYLRFHLRDQVPAGITDPTISIIGAGRLSGQAIVDLDAVGQSIPHVSWVGVFP